jgi:protein-tyrosine phosphatase
VVDLHCHILPGVDDGSRDLDDSVAMALQAEADGITTICATPHVRHDHEVDLGGLAARVAELDAELRRRRIPVQVVTGAEVAESAVEALSDAELELASLGGSGRWILLEPAPGPLGEGLRETVEELAGRGFRGLLAHPERHLGERYHDRLAQLVEQGALVQVTAAALEGRDPASLALAAAGLVHVVSSDAHSSRIGRRVRISGALAALRELERLRPHLDWLARAAPAAIVRGEIVQPPYAPRFA